MPAKQLPLFNDLYRPTSPHKRGLRQSLHRFFFGDDIFISYSRADAGRYAMGLAATLSEHGYLCFLDQLGTDVNRNMPESLKAKVRGSTALVLIGTSGAAVSRYVREEVEIFKESRRPIHPISVDDALTKEEWPELAGLTWISESRKSVESGAPASETITQLKNASRYRRRNQVLRLSLLAGFAFIAMTVMSSVMISWMVVAGAEDRRVKAESAAGQAKSAADRAAINEGNATVAMGLASGQEAIAKFRSAEAVTQQRLAEAGMRQAQELERQAQERATAISRMEQGSRATLYSREPGREFQALTIAVQAAKPEVATANGASDQVIGGLTAAVTALDRVTRLEDIYGNPEFTQISRDGRLVFVSLDDKKTKAERWGVWDAVSGKPLPKLSHLEVGIDHLAEAICASFSGDGKRLAVIDRMNTLFIWDLERPTLFVKINSGNRIQGAALDGDGSHMALTNLDSVYLVELKPQLSNEFGNSKEIKHPLKRVLKTVFTPKGKLILAGQVNDPGLQDIQMVYDPQRCPEAPIDADCKVSALGGKLSLVLEDNTMLVLSEAGGGAYLTKWAPFRVETVRALRGLKGTISSATLAEDRPRIVTLNGGSIYIEDSLPPDNFPTLRAHHDSLVSARYSPDGKVLVTTGDDSTLNVWNPTDGQLLHRLKFHEHGGIAVRFIAFSADSKRLAAIDWGGWFRVWNLETGAVVPSQCLLGPEALNERSRGISFMQAPDGSERVLTATQDNFRVWDLQNPNAERLLTIEANKDNGTGQPDGDGVFSPDGKRAVTVNKKREVRLWDLALNATAGPQPQSPQALGTLPEGGVIATVVGADVIMVVAKDDGLLQVWHSGNGQSHRLQGSLPNARFGALSEDGSRVAAYGEGEVVIWDARSGKKLVSFECPIGNSVPVSPLAFSPDGERLVVVLANGTARVYPTTQLGFLRVAESFLSK